MTRVEPDEGVSLREQRLECLDCCLHELKPEQRELVVEYYRDAKRQKIDRRRELAARLGISMNALGIRAWRIRYPQRAGGLRGNLLQGAATGLMAPHPIGSSHPGR
jgi:hypothetical protein